MTKTEKITLVILLFTIGLWITTGITKIDSYSVALIGASLYFISGVINWKDAQQNIDWGLIIFFGGALSLGATLLNTGAAAWLVQDLIGMLGTNVLLYQ
jgi:sodium-dependent dicarboxylate transporter 2/3/5